jgi:glycosyltransferase involved in cell wall biosynthesis
MRLALLTQYYPPETGAPQNRLSDLARRLVARGHRVEVLTALPSYPGDHILPEYVGREDSVEDRDGVRVARVGLFVPRRKTFPSRLANYLSFAGNAALRGPGMLSRCDVLMMESPPLFLALAGIPLSRRLGARLVVNVSDLWPQSVVALGMMRPGPALWPAHLLEALMYRSAALVTGQTEGIVEDVRRRFPRTRVALYPNGVDVDAYEPPLDRAGVRREFGWPDALFVVGYAGLLGHSQALGQVLDAARLLAGRHDLHLALFGEGPCREELQARIAGEGIDNVRLYPRQPAERMPHVQAAFDAGLVPLARGRLFEGARPSKMFEVMAAARPLVLCAAGEAVRVMNAAPGGPAGVVAPEEPRRLAEQVSLLLADRTAAAAMGQRGREHALRNFDREAIAGRVETLLVDVAEGRRR